jgi:FkbM family methyltransferase
MKQINIMGHNIYDNFLNDELTVIDLGACQGEFIKPLEEAFKIKKAILVEVNLTNFNTLEDKPYIKRYYNAIGANDGESIIFNIDPHSPYNASKDFNWFNGIQQEVQTISLETLCKENDIDFIDILKIDIEGSEYEVLENISDDLLSKIDQITVEFHDFIDPELRPRTTKIIDRLTSLGFNYINSGTTQASGTEYYDVLFYRRPLITTGINESSNQQIIHPPLLGQDLYHSQIGQDKFVTDVLKEKTNGTFLDIGCHHYKNISNTYYLEKELGWTGIGIDVECRFEQDWIDNRPNSKFVCADATTIDYNQLLSENNMPEVIDYLTIDLEPPITTFRALEELFKTNYKFRVITFETDYYRERLGWTSEPTREMSRKLFQERGYILVKEESEVDDFYIHPSLIS